MIGRWTVWRPSVPRMWRVASMPSRPGIWRSISTRSWRAPAADALATSSMASCPSRASVTRTPHISRVRRPTSRFISLSSTRSTWRPARSALVPSASGRSPDTEADGTTAGSVTVNVLPSPSTLSTAIVPSWRSTRSLTMASPKPVPPNRRAASSAACVNGSKMAARRLAGIPMPVSETRIWSQSFPSAVVTSRSIVTLPSAVNLTAFEARLVRICRNRVGSPRTRSGTLSLTTTRRSRPWASARIRRMVRTLAAISEGRKGMVSNGSCPAPRRAKSRRSSMRLRRASADVVTPSRSPFWSGESGV